MCQKFSGRKGSTRCKRCPIRYHCMEHIGGAKERSKVKKYIDTQHRGEHQV